MSKKKHNIPLDLLANYEKLIGTIPEIEIKGATTRYTSLNGNMFSFISKEGSIGLRLSEEDRIISVSYTHLTLPTILLV